MYIEELEKQISSFILNSDLNFAEDLGGMQIFDQPLIGVASASDPMWNSLKKPGIVGPNHLTPKEWMPQSRSVISYFLPFTKKVRQSNRPKGTPSKEWVYGRYDGEIFNNALRSFIVAYIESVGNRAMAPGLDKRFTVSNFHVSNWSERHAAFIAGLGTFSLSYSLITNQGTAGRFGSVLVDAELKPTIRPYNGINDNCDKCGTCIGRCPSNAITHDGKDKERCSQYLNTIYELYEPRYGCGKCQTAVPCEFKNPNMKLKG